MLAWAAAAAIAACFGCGGGGVPAAPAFTLSGENGEVFGSVIADAGESAVVRVVAGNAGTGPMALGRVFPSDVEVGEDGAVRLGNEGACWFADGPRLVLLPRDGERELTWTVEIPEDAKAGRHVCALVVENVAPLSAGPQFSVVVRQVFPVVVNVR